MHSVDNEVKASAIILSAWASFLFSAVRLEFSELPNGGHNFSGRCRDMHPKPKQFATQYASIFGDASVVSAYPYRPPYPAETFELLLSLLDADAETRTVLDAGCGLGVIAR